MTRRALVRENWVSTDEDGNHTGRHLTYADAFNAKPAGGSVQYLPENDA